MCVSGTARCRRAVENDAMCPLLVQMRALVELTCDGSPLAVRHGATYRMLLVANSRSLKQIVRVERWLVVCWRL